MPTGRKFLCGLGGESVSHVVDGAVLSDDLPCNSLRPGVSRQPLDAQPHPELKLLLHSMATFRPGLEVEGSTPAPDAMVVHSALEDPAVGEEDQILLGVVLDNLDFVAADAELFVEGVNDVVWLRLVAIAAEPTNRRLADDGLPLALDGACRGDRADSQLRASVRVAGVGLHGRRLTLGCLEVGASGRASGRTSGGSSGRWSTDGGSLGI